jgi:AcrR family transcriptional regulator
MGRKPLKEDDIAEFQDRICDVAADLIAENGFEGLTLRRLAGELGCSHTTPYRYFESKEDIFLAVRARCLDRFAAHQEAAARGPTAEARLRALGRGYVSYARRQPAAFRISFQLDQPAAPDHEPLQLASARAWAVLHSAVQDATDEGTIVGDVDTFAHLIWSAVHGIASLHLADKLRQGRSTGALVEPMLDALLDAHRPNRGR